jgi:hypothetical protein
MTNAALSLVRVSLRLPLIAQRASSSADASLPRFSTAPSCVAAASCLLSLCRTTAPSPARCALRKSNPSARTPLLTPITTQKFAAHREEDDPELVARILERSREHVAWVINKYRSPPKTK